MADELYLIKEITIDLNSERNYFLKPLRFTEGDNVGIKAYIVQDKVAIPLVRFQTARLLMRFPSGFEYGGEMTKVYIGEGAEAEDDGLVYMFGEEMTSHGPVVCRVQLINGTDVVSTQEFTIVFDPS